MAFSYGCCTLCARNCRADRVLGKFGACRMSDKAVIARAALHKWEEPPISGNVGSGAIFFSGCSLGCMFCQNREISRGQIGKIVSAERLADIMLNLEAEGAHNINLVTPTHFAPTVKEALIKAKAKGLDLPIVYNTSSYDTVETLKELDGLVDIYLPDLKYHLTKTAKRLSGAENYPEVAKRAIAEMVRQCPKPIFEQGIMKSGVIVRLLLLPAHVAETKLSLKYLFDTYENSIYISLMSQYTPISGMTPPLNRRVTRAEYSELVEYAGKLGVNNGFIQELDSADEIFIPQFDNTSVE